ncbi:MAG: hypothetical protein AB7N24_04975 [Dehalococcoidia bacterium]
MNGRARTAAELASVSAAAALFLGMYLSTIGLGEAVARGDFGPPAPQMIERADEFGVLWRHGQTGWPIYVPGFFVSAFAVAPSIRHRKTSALAITGAGLVSGWLVAATLAPLCARFVAADFAGRNDLPAPAAVSVVSPLMGYPAAITFMAWTTLVLSFGFALKARHWRLFVPAFALYAVVAGIRGSFAFGELARTWFAESLAGDEVAIASLVVAASGGALLAVYFASLSASEPSPSKTRRNGPSTP